MSDTQGNYTLDAVATPDDKSRRVLSSVPGEPPSILILAKDEEVNLGPCLDSLTFSDDIVVLDSFSTDKTLEIAAKYPNVRIIQRKFDNWSKHSNWALENIKFKHAWVYYSDADERVTPELRDELVRTVNNANNPHVAFRLRYKNMFMGRWLRHGGIYPVWIIRLFKPEMIRYEEREVNAHPVMKGTLGDLQEHFIHYSFNKGLMPWFKKHNSYSTMEANEAVRIVKGSAWSKVQQVFDKSPGAKRRAVKDLSFFLPLRGFVRFLYMYFVRLAFLDGRAGFHYSAMISMYEYWIEIKIREQQKTWHAATTERVEQMLDKDPPSRAMSLVDESAQSSVVKAGTAAEGDAA